MILIFIFRKYVAIKVSKYIVTIVKVLIKMTIIGDLELNYSGGYSRWDFPKNYHIYKIMLAAMTH